MSKNDYQHKMKRKVIDILNDYLVLRDMGDSYLMHYISEQDGMRYGNKISVRKDSPLEVNDTWEETPQRGAGLYQAWCVHPLSDIEVACKLSERSANQIGQATCATFFNTVARRYEQLVKGAH